MVHLKIGVSVALIILAISLIPKKSYLNDFMKGLDPIVATMANICWDKLTWSYRPYSLSEISLLTRDLFAEIPEHRHRASQTIENTCAVQGSLSEAAFYLIPFIREGLARNLDRAESALSLFTNLASSFSSFFSTRVFFGYSNTPFSYFIPDASGMTLFLDHACQMSLVSTAPLIADGFDCLNEDAQMEAVSFIAGLSPQAFAVQWMIELKRSRQLLPPVLAHVNSWLKDPSFQKLADDL